ncbi:MbtH family NRPS accessory protein [Streptomyces sp. NPDC050560]|uniref:MbtH family NRPS accessory protein n=1 Tax=Streptomyces sp. NPDC050560 TaxID=3365630 RepID=UPI003795A622
MTAGQGPFEPDPAGGDGADGGTHLVLVNAAGLLSLWPVWRAVPDGWTVRSGPAPYDTCAAAVGSAPGV